MPTVRQTSAVFDGTAGQGQPFHNALIRTDRELDPGAHVDVDVSVALGLVLIPESES